MAEKKRMAERDAKGRWKNGNSGNPNGRPAARVLSEWIRTLAEDTDKSGKTKAQLIAERLIHLAIKGRPHVAIRAAALLYDRADGKARQSIAVEDMTQRDIVVRFADEQIKEEDEPEKAEGDGE